MLAETATLEDAERALDEVCWRVTEQVAVNGEGSWGLRLDFEIVDTEAGRAVEWLIFSPDPECPYLPLADTADVLARLRGRT